MKSLLWFSVILITLYGLYLELFSGVDAVRVFYDWGVFRWVLRGFTAWAFICLAYKVSGKVALRGVAVQKDWWEDEDWED